MTDTNKYIAHFSMKCQAKIAKPRHGQEIVVASYRFALKKMMLHCPTMQPCCGMPLNAGSCVRPASESWRSTVFSWSFEKRYGKELLWWARVSLSIQHKVKKWNHVKAHQTPTNRQFPPNRGQQNCCNNNNSTHEIMKSHKNGTRIERCSTDLCQHSFW